MILGFIYATIDELQYIYVTEKTFKEKKNFQKFNLIHRKVSVKHA